MTRPPPLAATLRGYAASAPALWRPHLAAAADAVEECARLRAELDTANAICAHNAQIARDYRTERDAALTDAARAELDEVRALLQWSRIFVPKHDSYFHNPYIGEHLRCETCAKRKRIDEILNALKEGGR